MKEELVGYKVQFNAGNTSVEATTKETSLLGVIDLVRSLASTLDNHKCINPIRVRINIGAMYRVAGDGDGEED